MLISFREGTTLGARCKKEKGFRSRTGQDNSTDYYSSDDHETPVKRVMSQLMAQHFIKGRKCKFQGLSTVFFFITYILSGHSNG